MARQPSLLPSSWLSSARPDSHSCLFLYGLGAGYHSVGSEVALHQERTDDQHEEQEKLYPSKTEIKNLRVLKIIFPIAVTTIVALFVPTAVPLIGMLMFGNLIKEIGSDTSRLFDAAANSIMNAATIFLGLSVGATMTSEAFLNWTTIGIVIGGFLAFALSISGGILFVKVVNLFSKKKINPLIGATGLSAVPMASRVCNEIATKYDPKNHVLNYCMSSNISGVIGSAVAAGVLISFLG